MLKDWEHIRKYHESTPLQGAIHRKKEAAVRLLLEAKADPNAPGEHTWFKDGPKRPHLTTTVVQGWKAGLTLLLEAGADLFIHPYLLSWLFGEFGTMEQRRRLDCLDVLMAHNAHPLLTECTESGTVIRLLRDWSQEMNDRNQRKHKVLHILATLQKHVRHKRTPPLFCSFGNVLVDGSCGTV
jgi:hypothetical protein